MQRGCMQNSGNSDLVIKCRQPSMRLGFQLVERIREPDFNDHGSYIIHTRRVLWGLKP